MAKQGSRGSITQQKKRYNDDFMLNFNGSTQNLHYVSPTRDVTSTTDWAISFFTYIRNPNIAGQFACFYNDYDATTNFDGIFIGYNMFAKEVLITIRGSAGTVAVNYIISTIIDIRLMLKHLVINYNNTSKTFSLYIDSNFVGSATRTETEDFGDILTNDVRIGNRRADNGNRLNGLLRDFVTTNKLLSQQEISFIYERSVLPPSTHQFCNLHLPLNQIAVVDGANRLMLDVVSNYDYAKATPVTPTHGLMSGWSDDELGLNVGTSTFTAYADFYTKQLGVNFSGGGDSIIYKGKELRKFGISFNGINQYFRVPNFLPTSEKGYTILMMYKTVNGGYLMHKDLGGGKEFRQEAITGSNLHLSYSPITTGNDFITYDYVNSNNFEQLNFITAKHDSSILTSYNSDAKGVLSLNGSDEVLENGLDGLDGGFNDSVNDLYICAKSDATNCFDGILCYFAIAKGVLDNEEVKRIFNNGLLSNPSNITQNTQSEFVLIADLNNPFDDGGTLKLPNLGTTLAYEIIVEGSLDLPNLEARKVDINSLR